MRNFKLRKAISLVLVVIMISSLCGLTAFADSLSAAINEQTTKQVVGAGGTSYYLANGTAGTAGNYDVSVSKTLSATGTENLFNVDVNITYKNASTQVQSQDAAVNLVIDTSGSMAWDATTGKVKITSQSRLAAAKVAANNFLNSYAKDSNGNFYTSARWVSLISFSEIGYSSTYDLSSLSGTQYWVNVNNAAALSYVQGVISSNNLKALGGTNTGNGMRLAANVLNASTNPSIQSISNRFCILLTDGEPTLHDESYNDAGDFSSQADVAYAQTGCQAVTGTGAKLYAIAYGLGNTKVPVSGHGDVLITTWLQSYCGATGVYPSSNPSDLTTAFNTILNQTTNTGTTSSAVLDAMAAADATAYGIDFKSFTNANGATYDSSTGKISWSPAAADANPPTGYTSYSMSYMVQLDNTKNTFASNTPYSLGKVSFTYKDASTNAEHTVESQVPSVKGYSGSLSFNKVGVTGSALPNASFSLANTDVGLAYNVSSASDGSVPFAKIPSGYAYTLSENKMTGYQANTAVSSVIVAYGVVAVSGKLINKDNKVVNTEEQKNRNIQIVKTWQDTTTTHPSITVCLQQDGKAFKTLDLSATTSGVQVTNDGKTWTYTLSVPDNIPTTGGTHAYSVTEEAVSGYTTTYGNDGLSITNTRSGSTSVTVTKNWVLPTGISADSMAVTIKLLRDGSEYGSTTITGNGSYTFENLPAYNNAGVAFTYDVSEDIPSGATYRQVSKTGTASTGFTITNTVNQEYITVSGEKTWQQPNGTATPAITIALLKNGTKVNETTLQPGTTSYSFTTDSSALPLERYNFLYSGDTLTGVSAYNYTVSENTVSGYASIQSGNNFTNTITGTTSLTVNKVWIDQNGAEHGNVTVQLKANGTDYLAPVSFAGSYTFSDLPKYDSAGQLISYSVSESELLGFNNTGNTTVMNNDGTFTATLTNTVAQSTVTVTVNKTWKQPGDVTAPSAVFTLYADDVATDKTLTLNGTTTAGSFSGLDKLKYVDVVITQEVPDDETTEDVNEFVPAVTEKQAVPIVYTVVESTPAGYTSSGSSADLSNGDDFRYDFTNTITGTTSVTAEKVWKDLAGNDRDTSARISLYRSVNGNTATIVSSAPVFTTSNNETYTWSNLPKYDENGNLYTYTVQEESVAGYSTAITGSGTEKDPFVVINTINQAYTSFAVNKVWIDGGKKNHPDITINLLRDGKVIDTYTMPSTETSYTFGLDANKAPALDVYNADRTAQYTYSVEEVTKLDGYDAPIVEGSTITNRLEQNTSFSVTATKYWVDPSDYSHPNLTLVLKANGETVSTKTIGFGTGATAPTSGTATGDVWTYTWTNLNQYDDDRAPINYTVEENAVPGYKSETIKGDSYAFRNTIEQQTITVNGTKTWANIITEGVNTPSIVESVWVQLYRNGEAFGKPKQVTGTGSTWNFSFENLDQFNLSNGEPYEYTVKEGWINHVEAVEGTTAHDEFVPVENNNTITFGHDKYTVSYGETNSITNTYNIPQVNFYRIDRDYTTTGVSHTYYSFTGDVRSADGSSVSVNPDDYKVCETDHNIYSFVSEGSVTSVTFKEVNHVYVITLHYSRVTENPYIPPVIIDPTPTPTEIPEDDTPLDPAPTTIPDDGTPLNPAPAPSEPVMEIPEDGTPLAGAPVDTSVPQTGDNSNTALLAILATLSALGLGAIGITGKKKKHDK